MAETVVPTIMEIAVANGYDGDAAPKTVLAALDVLGYVLGTISTEIEALGEAYVFRGVVATESDLPSSGMEAGDVYVIAASSSYGGANTSVAWDGTAWAALGNVFQLSDASVTTAKLADGAVTKDKIDSGVFTALSDSDINAMFS